MKIVVIGDELSPMLRRAVQLNKREKNYRLSRSGTAKASSTTSSLVEGEEPGLRARMRRIGSPLLGEFPHAVVRVDCERCGRAGSYRKEGLVARFGADIALPDVLMALASCERRKDFSRPCGHGSGTCLQDDQLARARFMEPAGRRAHVRGRLRVGIVLIPRRAARIRRRRETPEKAGGWPEWLAAPLIDGNHEQAESADGANHRV